MTIRAIVATSLLWGVGFCAYVYAEESKTAADIERLEEIGNLAISRIDLMEEYRGSGSRDLANHIECSIDNALWRIHSVTVDTQQDSKYSPEQLSALRHTKARIINVLGAYRGKYPEAECKE